MFGQLKERVAAWRPAFGVLERELLVFPLAVVLLATAAFWFGGKCALWQTWGGGNYCLSCGGAGSPRFLAGASSWDGTLSAVSRHCLGAVWVFGRECL